MKRVAAYLLVLIVGVVIGSWLCREYHFRDATKMSEVVVDTLYLRDTIRIASPVHERVIETRDTLVVQIRDTTRVRDTLYMNLPLEKRVYKRDEFYAEVTGYEPRLTYIEIYSKDKVITKSTTTKPNRHSLSLGIEMNYSNAFYVPVQFEYSYHVYRWLDLYGYTEYELVRRQFGIGAGSKISFGW